MKNNKIRIILLFLFFILFISGCGPWARSQHIGTSTYSVKAQGSHYCKTPVIGIFLIFVDLMKDDKDTVFHNEALKRCPNGYSVLTKQIDDEWLKIDATIKCDTY